MTIKILKALKNYFRRYLSNEYEPINRRKYWKMLAIVIPCYLLNEYVVLPLLPESDGRGLLSYISSPYFIIWVLLFLFYLGLFIDTSFNRCRDIGISHWYAFLIFVDYLNIALIILLCTLETGSGKKMRELKELYFGKKKK